MTELSDVSFKAIFSNASSEVRHKLWQLFVRTCVLLQVGFKIKCINGGNEMPLVGTDGKGDPGQ